MVPNLGAVIAVTIGLVVSGFSIVRQRELGTFDQLLASPLQVHEILIGKTVPSLLIGCFHCALFTMIAVLWLGVPLPGSLLLFYIAIFFYLLPLALIALVTMSAAAWLFRRRME